MGNKKIWKIPIILIIITILFTYLFHINNKLNNSVKTLQNITFFIFLPANIILKKINKNLYNVRNYFINVEDIKEENIKLKKELNKYKNKTNILYEYYLQNKRLTKLLNLKRNFSYKTISTNILYSENNPLLNSIIIDKGKESGIKEGMGVITSSGLIGRIYKVFNGYSQVLLIINPESKIGAILQNSRKLGVLQGNNKNCLLKYIPKEVNVKLGEKVITAPTIEGVPKGILLGRVTRISKRDDDLFSYIEVKPHINFINLEEVLVIIE